MAREKILIPYYRDEDNKALYQSPDGHSIVRTQFFSDEQLVALHKQTNKETPPAIPEDKCSESTS